MEGEWSAFNEIIRRKDCAIQVQVASLQVKIVAEDKAVEARTNDVLVEWEKSKPVEVGVYFLEYLFCCKIYGRIQIVVYRNIFSLQGSLRPQEAMGHLSIFESKFSRLKEDRDNVMRAKEALELQEPGTIIELIFFLHIIILLIWELIEKRHN